MTPLDLFRKAESLGLKLEPLGEKLRVTPAQRCPPEFAAELREHKSALLHWLSNPPSPPLGAVPPADLPLNPRMPAPSMADARTVMSYLMRQIGDKPGPLCEWCLKRELAYWETYHWPDQTCAYAAARDMACHQTARDEWRMIARLGDLEQMRSIAGNERSIPS